jgi:WW domain-binding protein 2
LIYIPAKPTEEFKSFATIILNVENSHISSPLFGSWYWLAEVKPVSQGNIPPDIVRVELKLTFKDGGHIEFRDKFEEIKERLAQVAEIQRASGHAVSIPDEPLPAYEARQENPAPAPSGSATLAPEPLSSVVRSTSTGSQNPRAPPDEPPPAYDEAQAQLISSRLEDHIREEASRQ